MIFDGAGGQAPVFYNQFVAAAAIVVDALLRPSAARLGARAAAMALVRVAMHLKYTVALEGAVFGVTQPICLRREDAGWTKTATYAAAWSATALAPTIAAFCCYLPIGQGDDFVFANFDLRARQRR